jgi:hypothetical protein
LVQRETATEVRSQRTLKTLRVLLRSSPTRRRQELPETPIAKSLERSLGAIFQQPKVATSLRLQPEVILSRAKAIPTEQKNSPAFVLNGLRTAFRLL